MDYFDSEKNNLNLQNDDDNYRVDEDNRNQGGEEFFHQEEERFYVDENNDKSTEDNVNKESKQSKKSNNKQDVNSSSASATSSVSAAVTLPTVVATLVGAVVVVAGGGNLLPTMYSNHVSIFLSRSTELGFEVSKDPTKSFLIRLSNDEYDSSEEIIARNQFVFTDLMPSTTYNLDVYDLENGEKKVYSANYLTKSHDHYFAFSEVNSIADGMMDFFVNFEGGEVSFITVEIFGDNSKSLMKYEGEPRNEFTVFIGENTNVTCKVSINGELTHFSQMLNPDNPEPEYPWIFDENNHWHEIEGEIVDVEPHNLETVVTQESTFEEHGLAYDICKVCGYETNEYELPLKEHSYSTTWDYNETHHWHNCIDAGYEDLKGDYAEHNLVETERLEPTYDLKGHVKYTCEECGYYYYEELPIKEHTYSDIWSSDNYTHWHACIDEGYESLKGDEASHDVTGDGVCECGYSEFKFQLISGTNTVRITGLKGNVSFNWANLELPSTFSSYVVTDISSKIFTNGGVITAYIPDSYTHLSEQTFYGCGTLTELDLPFIGSGRSPSEATEKFFGYIFGTQGYAGDCYWVDLASYGGQKTLIPKSLTTINIRGGVIADHALRGLLYLEHLSISGVSSIGSYAFADYQNILSIKLSKDVTSIGANAFENNPLQLLEFDGTIAEWEDITKNTNWNVGSSLTTVSCTDGNITL